MNDFDDTTITDITEIVDKDFYSLRAPSDFEMIGEVLDHDDTDIGL